MPKLGKGKVDYNLAMDPALLQAGKIVAAAEDRNLADLLRFLLRQHIEQRHPDEARNIYDTSKDVPHGARINRFGRPCTITMQVPEVLYDMAKAQATWEERSLTGLGVTALRHYLAEAGVNVPEEDGSTVIEGQTELDDFLEDAEEAARRHTGLGGAKIPG